VWWLLDKMHPLVVPSVPRMAQRALFFAVTAAVSFSSVLGFPISNHTRTPAPLPLPTPAPAPLPTPGPPAPTPSSTTQPFNITQVHLAFGHDAAMSMSVAWLCGAGTPLSTTYAAASSLPTSVQASLAAEGVLRQDNIEHAQAAAEAVAAVGTAANTKTAPFSTYARYTIDDSPWGFPVVWVGDDYDNAVPTYETNLDFAIVNPRRLQKDYIKMSKYLIF